MRLTVKEMALVSMFAALACIPGLLIKLGGEAVVPFSILPFVAVLAGVLLGGRLGALSMLVYMLIGLAGVPVFSAAPFGGPAYLIKPTAGFLFGFIGAAYSAGRLARLDLSFIGLGRKSVVAYLIGCISGIGVLYVIGLPYLYVVLNFIAGKAVNVMGVLKIGFLPFIGLDLLKAVAAAVIAVPVSKQVETYIAKPSR